MGSAGANAGAVICGEADLYLHAGGQCAWDAAAPVAAARWPPACMRRGPTAARWFTTSRPSMEPESSESTDARRSLLDSTVAAARRPRCS